MGEKIRSLIQPPRIGTLAHKNIVEYQMAYSKAVSKYLCMRPSILRTNLEYFRKQLKGDSSSHEVVAAIYAIHDILESNGERTT